MQSILVTGVTGAHGGTGAFVATQLLARGIPVRALVRGSPDRAAALRSAGAEIVTGDLNDPSSLTAALKGVETAYFTYPVAAGIAGAAAGFASAGRRAGLKRVVVMSMGAAHPESPSALGRAQHLAEEVLEWAGFSCLHLRIAAFFFENLELLHGHELREEGVMRNAFDDTPVSWLAAEDVARLAVAALLEPGRFGAGPAVYPSGGVYTQSEIAGVLSAHLGRPVRHETISKEAWEARLLARAAVDTRISPAMARHISTVAALMRKPPRPSDLFEKVTSAKPLTLAEALASGRLTLESRARHGRDP